ncbi:bone morphogenetic protein 15 precursor, partial [Silurus asotus]
CSHPCQELKMKAACSQGFLRLCVLSCCFLLLPAFTCAADKMAFSPSHLGVLATVQSRRKSHPKQRNPNSNAFLNKQTEDQSLQFMWSLYRKAANVDGRPKQRKLFGSNTVRLIRASVTGKRFYSSPNDLLYTYTVQYELENLPLSKLNRASFIHLRSPVPSYPLFLCEARVSSSSSSSSQRTNNTDVVILGPQSMWTESDATSHMSLLRGSLFVLYVQYKCWESGSVHSVARHRTRKRQFPPQNHLRAPALLLFLEEEGPSMAWAKYTKATPHTGSRSRRSKEIGSIGSDIPNYKRPKNGVGKNQCKLHSYRVTFRDLGWDHWIIAPPMYNPRYCMGDCPRILHYGYNSPNHAIVQTVISELGVADIPLPSCVPYKYKPISVLMMEKNGSIVYKEYEDMIAESCTCR